MTKLLSTREVSKFINVNEKMVYTLVSEKGLPATKITGKWLFPQHLVEQWVEANTINFPKRDAGAAPYKGLLVIAGSNDLLLDRAITLFNTMHSEHLAVFGNLGSMGGLRALRRDLCHLAASHLLQEDESEYNFAYASEELGNLPAVVNFCRREQGIIVRKGNPKKISECCRSRQAGAAHRQPSPGDRHAPAAGSGAQQSGPQRRKDRRLHPRGSAAPGCRPRCPVRTGRRRTGDPPGGGAAQPGIHSPALGAFRPHGVQGAVLRRRHPTIPGRAA